VTQAHNHLPEGVRTPPISFLGCNSPEHEVYQIGFSITGIFLAICMYLWFDAIYPAIVRAGFTNCAYYSKVGGIASVVGVIGQGLITLEENLAEKLGKPGLQLTLQSKSVFSSSFLFFLLYLLFFFLRFVFDCHRVMFMPAYDHSGKLSKVVVKDLINLLFIIDVLDTFK
jgi:hypothetical protein